MHQSSTMTSTSLPAAKLSSIASPFEMAVTSKPRYSSSAAAASRKSSSSSTRSSLVRSGLLGAAGSDTAFQFGHAVPSTLVRIVIVPHFIGKRSEDPGFHVRVERNSQDARSVSINPTSTRTVGFFRGWYAEQQSHFGFGQPDQLPGDIFLVRRRRDRSRDAARPRFPHVRDGMFGIGRGQCRFGGSGHWRLLLRAVQHVASCEHQKSAQQHRATPKKT